MGLGELHHMTKKICIEIKDLAYPISLEQQGHQRFTVTYGKQVRTHLNYSQAAAELGSCIMHALACEARLDNRGRGE